MSLYAIKPWFLRRLRRVEDALVARRAHPDALTLGALVLSVVAGAAIALGGLLAQPLWWLAVPPLVVARLALNALDGSVARRTRRARPFGAALNEVGDRLADAATIGATAFVVGPALATGAVACAFLASMTGVLAHALAGARDNAGPMGKADRAAALSLGAVAGALAGSDLPVTVAVSVIAAGSAATAGARLARLRRALRARGPAPAAVVVIEIPAGSPIEEEMLHALGR